MRGGIFVLLVLDIFRFLGISARQNIIEPINKTKHSTIVCIVIRDSKHQAIQTQTDFGSVDGEKNNPYWFFQGPVIPIKWRLEGVEANAQGFSIGTIISPQVSKCSRSGWAIICFRHKVWITSPPYTPPFSNSRVKRKKRWLPRHLSRVHSTDLIQGDLPHPSAFEGTKREFCQSTPRTVGILFFFSGKKPFRHRLQWERKFFCFCCSLVRLYLTRKDVPLKMR